VLDVQIVIRRKDSIEIEVVAYRIRPVRAFLHEEEVSENTALGLLSVPI
jgi:hypothetical protein